MRKNRIFKIFKGADNSLNDKTFLVRIPDDYDRDYLHFATDAVQTITGNYGYCGSQMYDEFFDGKIPEGKKIWEYAELMACAEKGSANNGENQGDDLYSAEKIRK